MATEFRFRARYRSLPIVVVFLAAAMVAAVFVFHLEGANRTFAYSCAAVGALIGLLYAISPTWRYRVICDDEALAVMRGSKLRFRLPWNDVKRVVAAPDTKTCFVDGGEVTRSLLVPGPGAPGPYRIERREELYAYIVAHVPAEKVREVASLETTRPGD